MNNYDEALWYGQRMSWKVFPVHYMRDGKCSCGKDDCSNAGKHPMTASGFKDASDEPAQVKALWKNNSSNIGIVTGEASGIIVIDVDMHGIDGKAELEKLFKKYNVTGFPITPQCKTGGGGLHYYFKYNSSLNRTKKLTGIDVKSNGGYVLAAPSNHKSGNFYSWLYHPKDNPLAEIPQWFIDALMDAKGPERPSVPTGERPFIKAHEGRNDYLTKIAGKMRRSGLEQDEIELSLIEVAHARCEMTPDFTDTEVLNIARSVSRYEKGPGQPTATDTHIEISPYIGGQLIEDLANTKPGLETGYKKLDSVLSIPQEAITIIGGRPSHGKTSFLFNLFLNMIRAYSDKAFFFFSYEETRKQIAVKLINILGQHCINEKQNIVQIENYLRGHGSQERGKANKIDAAYNQYNLFASNQRLFIIDEPFKVNTLTQVIGELRQKYDIGAVFIDYIQKIRGAERYGTRQLEIQDISGRLLDAAKHNSIPIIMGAQLGRANGTKNDILRLDNLREAGDIEQDANTALLLWNQSMQEADEKGQPLRDRKVNLELHVRKNRNGEIGGVVKLEFDRPLLTIAESTDTTSTAPGPIF